MKDKVVIVTGATKGMGLAISRQLLATSAKVVMVYCRDQNNAEQVAKSLCSHDGNFLMLQADVTEAKGREKIIKMTIEKFGAIHVLVNNAGVAARHNFLKVAEDELDTIGIDIPVDGGFLAHCPGRD